MSRPIQPPTLIYTHTHSPSLYFPQSKTLTLIHHRRQINPITNIDSPTVQPPFSVRRVERSIVVRSSVKGSSKKRVIDEDEDKGDFINGVVKIGLWVLEGVYISWLFLLPFAPKKYGVAERMNRTIMEKVLCMLSNAGLDKSFWAEAASTACYLVNRSPHRSLDTKTPEEVWSGRSGVGYQF